MQIGKIKWDQEMNQVRLKPEPTALIVHNYATALANFKCVSLVFEYF